MKSALFARLRTRLHETSELLARRAADRQVTDWSRPLIGEAQGQVGVTDLLAEERDADLRQGSAGWQPQQPLSDLPPDAPRCLLITVSGQLDVGGLGEVVAFLARRLPAHGLRTAVLRVTPRHAGKGQSAERIAGELRAAGVEVYEADEDAVGAHIEQWAPDVISAHGAPFSVFTAAERARVPFVENLHGQYGVFGTEWRWHREASAGSTLAAVVVVSDLLRRDYLACNPEFPPDRLVTIPNAVNPGPRLRGNRAATRRRLGITNEYLFVSLARHCVQKNTFGLVAAFGEMAIHHPGAHLVLAGRPDDYRYFNKVLQLRDSLPCSDRIHLRDHTMTPGALLAAADGFVLDSFFEGGPIASMEAMFAGVPVVLSDMGCAREQVADDPDRGYVVTNPLGNPLAATWETVGAAKFRPQVNQAEFASRMDTLVAERERYAAGRERLAAESVRRFSANAWLARHATLLISVAHRKALPAIANS